MLWKRSMVLGLMASLLVTSAETSAQRRKYGIAGQSAPEWGVDRWFNLPKGKKTLALADYRGKVVYVYAFQSWCPGCHKHGFPTLQKLVKHFDGEDDVAFVAIQTVFEGHKANTMARARAVARKFKLKIPFGHDTGPDGKRSLVMRRYRTGGTPWSIVIDKNGQVVRNDYFLKDKDAIKLIDKLRSAPTLLGRRLSGLSRARGIRWLTGDGKPVDPGSHPLTLLRWWTDDGPFCKESLPALEKLRRKYPELRMVGIYHPKPARKVTDDAVRQAAKRLGYQGELAVDAGWDLLKSVRERGAPRSSTSISILVDRSGKVIWMHAGPSLHPSKDEQQHVASAGYRELDELVGRFLKAKKKATRRAGKE